MENIALFVWSMFLTTIKCLFISIVIAYVWAKIRYRKLNLSPKEVALIFYKYGNAGKKANLAEIPLVAFMLSFFPIIAIPKVSPLFFLIYCLAVATHLIFEIKESVAEYLEAK